MKEKQMIGCNSCDRREFLKNLGILAGAGFIAPGMLAGCGWGSAPGSAIPDKKGAVKVRLVFAYHLSDVQDRPDWPNIGFDFGPVMKNMTDSLNAGVKGVEFIPTKANSLEDGKAIAEQDATAGDIAGYLVVQLNCWNTAVLGIVSSGKPILYTTLPYAGDGGWLRYNTRLRAQEVPYYESIACFDFKHVVGMARSFEKLRKGTADDYLKAARAYRLKLTPTKSHASSIHDHVDCLSPGDTLEKLKGMKILSVQNDDQRKFQCLKQDFGIDCEVIPYEMLHEQWEMTDPAEARKIADAWQNGARSVQAVTDETIFGCARMYLGMKNLLAAHGAQAITINCLGGCYSGKIKSYPCLGFMQLQDDGMIGVCENDLDSTVTMMLFNAFTRGRMGYVSDPVLDAPTRSISYAHCVSTRRFFGKDGAGVEYEILTHSEDRQGASVRVFAPVGYPVTTVKVNLLTKSIAMHPGVVTGNDCDDRACRTKIVAEVPGDFEKIYDTWGEFGWHRVTFVGDFSDQVAALAEKLGYTLKLEC